MRERVLLAVFVLLGACAGPDREGEPDASTSPTTSPPPEASGTTWITKAKMPEPRGEVTCTSLGDRIYVFSGYAEARTASARLDVYHSKEDRWTRAADAPMGMHHAQIVAYRGDLFVPGGYTTSNFQGTNLFLRYSPAMDAWNVQGLMPRARGAHAALVVGDDLYVIGGRVASPGEVYASVDIYNFTTAQWRTGPAMSVAREHIAAAFAGGHIVVAGGRPGTLNVTETLRPGATSWTLAPPMPTARSGLAIGAWDDEAVAFGGEMPGVFPQAEGYNVTGKAWRSHPDLPHPRHGLCAATLSSGIHVLGGGVQQGFSLSDHHEVLAFGAS